MNHSPFLINLSFLSHKPTGLSTYAINLLPELRYLDPTLLTYQNIPSFTCYPVANNINSDYGTKGHLRRLLWTQWQLSSLYRRSRSHLIFSPIPEAPLFANCRSIVTVHDLIPLRFGSKWSRLRNYFQFYVPQVLNQAEHIICNSESTASEITEFFGISAQKISPILLSYDANHFKFLNLPTDNYFLYLGRHDRHKNIHRLIAAFAALPNYQNFYLYLAGPNDERYTPEVREQVRELGLENHVKILDYVAYADLPSLINRAIALVFPTLWEGFGLPVIEAMSCGTPVICSNLSALPEVAGDASILVDPYSVPAITDAMQAVGNSELLRSQLRSLGLARAKLFNWEKTGKQTAAILGKYL